MARRESNANGKNKKGAKKEFKNQGYKMRGKLEKYDLFGKNNEHAWFVITDDVNETKYTFKFFNLSDDLYDRLADSEKVEVYFNICYNRFNNNVQLQLVATEIHNAD